MKLLRKFVHYLSYNFYDWNFHDNKGHYFFQCCLMTVVLVATLLTLNIFPNVIVVASIGATSFTVFAMPHKIRSRSRYIVGGYSIGIVIGSLCYFTSDLCSTSQYTWLLNYHDELFGALAVGLSMLLMTITNLEHPPAVALALGFVIQQWSVVAIIVTLLAVFVLLTVRYFLCPYMIDLA